ncbi:hypothetical protein K461DRAFT_165375 [Myriangium duriaei CBS 260.36]|uniref:Uncharacterized protein n=1 Tax=Myriangium duriaei CBS 260.36 TaxID=1168546 RepID=A0A9P4J0G2_9PEZI|nr:hypothetical protein K461DRAFT_165375 [Myriangium duriaei CBS 260.36]
MGDRHAVSQTSSETPAVSDAEYTRSMLNEMHRSRIAFFETGDKRFFHKFTETATIVLGERSLAIFEADLVIRKFSNGYNEPLNPAEQNAFIKAFKKCFPQADDLKLTPKLVHSMSMGLNHNQTILRYHEILDFVGCYHELLEFDRSVATMLPPATLAATAYRSLLPPVAAERAYSITQRIHRHNPRPEQDLMNTADGKLLTLVRSMSHLLKATFSRFNAFRESRSDSDGDEVGKALQSIIGLQDKFVRAVKTSLNARPESLEEIEDSDDSEDEGMEDTDDSSADGHDEGA